MRRTSGLLAAVVCAGALLSSCSSESDDSSSTRVPTSSSTSSTSSATPDEKSTPVLSVPSDVSAVEEWEKRPQGANAGPGQPATTTQIYDNSASAKNDFFQWWNYEIQVPQDDREANAIYESGITVCASRARGVGATSIESVLATEFGYTPSGASGIVRGALVSLCPWYDLGYRTYFDRNATAFAFGVKDLITFNRQPFDWEYGVFMKEVCAAMNVSSIGGTGIYDHMASLVPEGYYSLVGNQASEDVLRILINESVKAGCMGFTTQLPPVIQMAS